MSARYLLRLSFVCALVLVVDAGEVGHDDGDGKGDDEHPGEGADTADTLAHHGTGHHVPVPAHSASHILVCRN